MKNKSFSAIILIIIVFAGYTKASAQLGVSINLSGALPDNSAILDVSSTDQGLLIPRMTQAQRNAISTPATSLMIYQTDNTPGYYYYNGSAWVPFLTNSPNGPAGWSLTGNGNTAPGTNFIGTTDNQDFVVKTNGTENIRVKSGGNVGIGNNNPSYPLDVNGAMRTGKDGTDGQMIIYSEQGGTDYSYTINPNAAMTQNVTLALPPDDGNADQFLKTDGSGNLTWADAGGSGGGGSTSLFNWKYTSEAVRPVTLTNISGGWVVPTDSILIITNLYSSTSYNLFINGNTLSYGYYNTRSTTSDFLGGFHTPIFANSGETVSTSNNACVINGYLMKKANIRPMTLTGFSGGWTVPTDSVFVITSIYSGTSATLTINSNTIFSGFYNYNPTTAKTLSASYSPVYADAGQSVGSSSATMVINGYLRPRAAVSSGGSSSSTNCIMLAEASNFGSGTYYLGLAGISGTETLTRVPVPKDGSLKNMRVVFDCYSSGTNVTFTVRKNGADETALQVTVGTGSTGELSGSDLAGTVAFTAGDYLSVKTVVNSCAIRGIRVTFEYE